MFVSAKILGKHSERRELFGAVGMIVIRNYRVYMLRTGACAHAWPTVTHQSTSPPTVPGPRTHTPLELGKYRSTQQARHCVSNMTGKGSALPSMNPPFDVQTLGWSSNNSGFLAGSHLNLLHPGWTTGTSCYQTSRIHFLRPSNWVRMLLHMCCKGCQRPQIWSFFSVEPWFSFSLGSRHPHFV